MTGFLRIAAGQHSEAGRKAANQDFHGLCVPGAAQGRAKGIVAALADGIGSSEFGRQAAESAVKAFLEDYYCTSDAWSVKTSAERVLAATNAWLYAQTRQGPGRFDRDRGWVCTFSALVLKSATAHVLHVGDARIWQLHGGALEPLTEEHRVRVAAQTLLGRALGMGAHVEIDYRAVPVAAGDAFVLATDGVHEFVDAAFVAAAVAGHAHDLDAAARAIAQEAWRRGSPDNLTVQVLRVEAVPPPQAGELVQQLSALPLPPPLEPRMEIDGYRILRELHASSRSHVHLAQDLDSGARVAIKTPAVERREDPAWLERFLMEEWVARRVDSAHVLRPCAPARERRHRMVVMEHVEGRTLAQWMLDHPRPELSAVRAIVGQLAQGLRAFHRLEMLHQDLRPENVMIDAAGTVKIVDFGAVRVAGLCELRSDAAQALPPGTAQFMAPEYFLGEEPTARSDLFSLGVIAYRMLTGALPYGLQVSRCRTRAAWRRLSYHPVREQRRDVPFWVDEAIRKAVHPDPQRRYADVSELVFDLQQPAPEFMARKRPPLIERDPVMFWKALSCVLAFMLALVLGVAAGR